MGKRFAWRACSYCEERPRPASRFFRDGDCKPGVLCCVSFLLAVCAVAFVVLLFSSFFSGTNREPTGASVFVSGAMGRCLLVPASCVRASRELRNICLREGGYFIYLLLSNVFAQLNSKVVKCIGVPIFCFFLFFTN